MRLNNFYRDSTGQIVIGQSPNRFIVGWILLKLSSLTVADHVLKDSLSQFSMAVLFVWALLEIFYGVNYFRRLFGFVVAVMLVI